MRKFAAACCCAIVGLQVLIGVPLVTCVVLFALAQGQSFAPASVEVRATNDSLPYLPPPLLATPYPTAATVPPPEFRSLPDLTAAVLTPAPIRAPEQLSPQVEDILAARKAIGSPLDGTLLADAAETPEINTGAFVARVERVVVEEIELPPPPREQVAEISQLACPPQVAIGAGNQPAQPTLRESLLTTVHQLYALAERLEADSSFERADRVRRLTRGLRDEIECLPGEGCPPPTPATVTEASYNPELPLAAVAVTASPATPDLVPPALSEAEPTADSPLNPAKPAP